MGDPENPEQKVEFERNAVPAPPINSTKGMYSGLKGKQGAWLRAYLNEANPITFMNKRRSAEAAGYNYRTTDTLSAIGNQNYRKLQQRILLWLDEVGLSEASIKRKIHNLAHAKKTKFFHRHGVITETVEVEALDIQAKMLKLAADIQGHKAPEKHEITGPNGTDLKWAVEFVKPGDDKDA